MARAADTCMHRIVKGACDHCTQARKTPVSAGEGQALYDQVRASVARGYCYPANATKTLDYELVAAISRDVYETFFAPKTPVSAGEGQAQAKEFNGPAEPSAGMSPWKQGVPDTVREVLIRAASGNIVIHLLGCHTPDGWFDDDGDHVPGEIVGWMDIPK